MFGHHNLYRDGVPARSVVISMLTGVENTVGHAKQEHRVDGELLPQETSHQKVFFDVVADVTFGDGTTVQHTERLWRHQVGSCHIGDVLQVRYDQHHRDKIVFDLPELEANRHSLKERADGSAPVRDQSTRMAGVDVSGLLSMVTRLSPQGAGGGDVQNLLSELTTDPRGFAAHVRQMAQESGSNTVVFNSGSGARVIRADQAQSMTAETDNDAGFPVNDGGFPMVDFGNNEVEDI